MQYCKADKAYYYRGDDSSFGLFNNNPDPANPSTKSLCTYAAQSFSLFSQMLETPYILQQNNIFNTGITTLAVENATGNKINVFTANFKANSSFTDGSYPSTETALYKQYCLDTSRTVDQIIDQYDENR